MKRAITILAAAAIAGVLLLPLLAAPPQAAVVARKKAAAAGGGINLTWTDNATDEQGYRIYKSTDGGTSYSLLQTEAADSEAATVSAVSTNKLKVVAYNDAGESDPSGIVTVP